MQTHKQLFTTIMHSILLILCYFNQIRILLCLLVFVTSMFVTIFRDFLQKYMNISSVVLIKHVVFEICGSVIMVSSSFVT